jgi:hypothetical protein
MNYNNQNVWAMDYMVIDYSWLKSETPIFSFIL